MALLHEINNGTERFSVAADGSVKVNNVYTLPTAVTTTANYVLTAQTDGSTAWEASTGTVTGSGTGQKVTKWTGSGASTVLGDGPITFATNDSTFAGKVTSDALELDYNTSYYNQDKTISAYSASNYVYVNGIGGASGQGLRLTSEGAATNQIGLENSNNSIFFNTNSTLALTLDSSQNATFAGNVGISVAATKALQVSGEALFGNGTDGLLLSYSGGNSSGIIDTGHSSTALEFRVGNTQELLINGTSATFAGNVGIGGAPSHTLDVKGADTNNATIARFYSNTGTRGSFVINNGTGVTPTTFIGTAGGSEQLSIGTNSTGAIRIDGSQNVGIGTASPTSPASVGTFLDITGRSGVGGGTAGIVLKDYDNDAWDIWTSGGTLNARYNNSGTSDGFGISSGGDAIFYTSTNQGGLAASSATDNTTVRIINTGTGGQAWRLQSTSGTSGLGQGKLCIKVGGTETAARLVTFTDDGSNINVGIGTTSPIGKLSVSNGGANGFEVHPSASLTELFSYNRTTSVYTNFHINALNICLMPQSTGNVGIGTTLPATKLHVSSNGTSTRFQSSISYSDVLFISTAGSNYINFGSSNQFLLYQGGGSGSNVTTQIDTSGNATFKGDVVAYGSPSDKRLKENIKPIESALNKVSKLQGVTFDWKEKTEHFDKEGNPINLQQWKHDIGFIAQDVQKVIPELVRENEDGMLSMRHQGMAPILLEAIKELKAEIEELKQKSCNCK